MSRDRHLNIDYERVAVDMAKAKTVYVCNECGDDSPKWAGRCEACGAWNSLAEMKLPATTTKAGGAGPAHPAGYAGEVAIARLGDVTTEEAPRMPTGMAELDRVLGGGLVAGAVTLVGGDPGIGKSTLLLQVVAQMKASSLYVTGEESLSQVSLRAKRLELTAPDLQVMAETCVEQIVRQAQKDCPQVMVIDSIQTMFSEGLTAAPGAVSQLREAAAQLVRFAKQSGTSIFLVGHVTKEGAIAGPRVLEHMVDTVLYFESEAGSRFRILRSIKNRFGAANELGVFAMVDEGLKEVKNPSAIFLQQHGDPVPGSVITVAREGSRPLLAEVQALVDDSVSHPRRVALGMDANRLNVLLAVLHRHAGVSLAGQDVFASVVGGLKINETAVDLALVLAALSSFRSRAMPSDQIVIGEIGLAGEIRPVPHGEERIREAAKHGFKSAILPAANAPKKKAGLDIKLLPVTRLSEAIALL